MIRQKRPTNYPKWSAFYCPLEKNRSDLKKSPNSCNTFWTTYHRMVSVRIWLIALKALWAQPVRTISKHLLSCINPALRLFFRFREVTGHRPHKYSIAAGQQHARMKRPDETFTGLRLQQTVLIETAGCVSNFGALTVFVYRPNSSPERPCGTIVIRLGSRRPLTAWFKMAAIHEANQWRAWQISTCPRRWDSDRDMPKGRSVENEGVILGSEKHWVHYEWCHSPRDDGSIWSSLLIEYEEKGNPQADKMRLEDLKIDGQQVTRRRTNFHHRNQHHLLSISRTRMINIQNLSWG